MTNVKGQMSKQFQMSKLQGPMKMKPKALGSPLLIKFFEHLFIWISLVIGILAFGIAFPGTTCARQYSQHSITPVLQHSSPCYGIHRQSCRRSQSMALCVQTQISLRRSILILPTPSMPGRSRAGACSMLPSTRK